MGGACLDDVLTLLLTERIQLVRAAWESVAAIVSAAPVTSVRRAELDHRLAALEPTLGAACRWGDAQPGLEDR